MLFAVLKSVARNQNGKAARPRFRPDVELLERREVPANFLVTSVADNGAGNYDSYAAIYDANTGINVQYFTTVTNTDTGQTVSQTAQTHLSASGQVLHIHLHLT